MNFTKDQQIVMLHDAARASGMDGHNLIRVGQKIRIPKAGVKLSVGDIVQFAGGPHYVSSSAAKPASSPAAGPAKVTMICQGAKHPYHIVHTTNASTVWGWVDADKVVKA